MALVIGSMLSEISGKVGGMVYARNRYGLYMRAFANPVNPNTDRQSAARARVSQMADRWNTTLTQTQRDGWNLYAANVPVLNRVGQTVYLTGFNHYVRSNTAILACGGTIVDAPPAVYTLPEADPTFAITISAATQLISVTFDANLDWVDEDDAYLSVQMGIPKLNQVLYFGGPWRFADSIDGDSTTPPTSPATIAVPWVVTQNQKVWCQARIIRADARVSNFFRGSAIVGA